MTKKKPRYVATTTALFTIGEHRVDLERGEPFEHPDQNVVDVLAEGGHIVDENEVADDGDA